MTQQHDNNEVPNSRPASDTVIARPYTPTVTGTAKDAAWRIFSRLYVYPINQFMCRCQVGFKEDLYEQFEVVSTRRGKWLYFEWTESVLPLTEEDRPLIEKHRELVLSIIYKIAGMYGVSKPLTVDEARMLAGWLRIHSVGNLLQLKLDEELP